MTEAKRCMEWVEGPYVRNLVWFRDRLTDIIEAIPPEHRADAKVELRYDPGTGGGQFAVHYRAPDYPGHIIDVPED